MFVISAVRDFTPIFYCILFRVGYNCTRSQVFRQKQIIAVSILVLKDPRNMRIDHLHESWFLVMFGTSSEPAIIIAHIRALQNSWSTNPEEVNIFLTIMLMYRSVLGHNTA